MMRTNWLYEDGGDPGALLADWLAGLFLGPLPLDMVESYRSAAGLKLLDVVAEETDCRAGVAQMKTGLASGSSAILTANELSTSYARLFGRPEGAATIPLYESAYTAHCEEKAFGQPLGQMELLLQLLDLSVAPPCREPLDHVSLELALLGVALRRHERIEAAFLRNRLLAWTPAFATRCASADLDGFYAGGAMVMTCFLQAHGTSFSAKVGDFVHLEGPLIEHAHVH